MVNETPSTPLTDQALAKLRKLAEGNGVDPAKIELLGTDEKIYTLEGTLSLVPKCDVTGGRHPGPATSGKNLKVMSDSRALQQEVQSRKEKFMQGSGWIDECLKELHASDEGKGANLGWGLEGAQITLPDNPVILAASSPCPACHGQKLLTCQTCSGQGMLMCSYCHGQRQERCPTCHGSGMNPANPNQPCLMCNGRRFVPCRYCNGSGQMKCPACHGQRGLPCGTCRATGQITDEAIINCGAETQFRLKSDGLPSGLRRGLDRLGIANLAKGHADITSARVKGDAEETGNKKADDKKVATVTPVMGYEAKMPYADMRMNFNGKKALVAVFGKRSVLLGVPNFLDDALEPMREKLKQAVQHPADLDEALSARLIREAMALELQGKSDAKELRRIYPVGLSSQTATEIFKNLRLVLKAATLRSRLILAVLITVASTALFAALFFTALHAQLMQNLTPPLQITSDIVLPLLIMGLGAFTLNTVAQTLLQRRYPAFAVKTTKVGGKTQLGMMAAILLIYVAILLLTPMKPLWLAALLIR